MKNYVKPNLDQINISVNTDIASLNDWLTVNGLGSYEGSITTYQYES